MKDVGNLQGFISITPNNRISNNNFSNYRRDFIMTIEEFENTSFKKSDTAIYNNKEYKIREIDFEQFLFLITATGEDFRWVRCETISLKNNK